MRRHKGINQLALIISFTDDKRVKRERQTDRQTDRLTDRQRQRQREKGRSDVKIENMNGPISHIIIASYTRKKGEEQRRT